MATVEGRNDLSGSKKDGSCCIRIPAFNELGSKCNQLMTAMYLHDQFKITASTQASKSLRINSEAINNSKNGNISSFVETVCSPSDTLKLHTRWQEDSSIDIKAVFTKPRPIGIKMEAQGCYQPKDQTCLSLLKGEIYRPYITTSLNMKKCLGIGDSSKSAGFSLDQAFVAGYKGNYIGIKASFLLDKGYMPLSSQIAYSYRKQDLELFGTIKDFKNLSWSLYADKSTNFKFGATLDYNTQDSLTEFSFGTQCKVDDKTTVASKFSSNFTLGLAIKHQVTDFANVCLSSELNMKNINQPGHRFGLGLEFFA